MGFRQIDPLILLSAGVSLFLTLETDPWWSISGATSNKLFTMEVSPYYFQTIATGISSGPPFVASLAPLTRLLLLLCFVTLPTSSIRPTAWWRELARFFILS